MDRRKVQAAMLLRDDIGYWRDRTDSETEAQVHQAAAQGMLIDLRKFTVQEKLCIAGARAKAKAHGDALILQMAADLMAIIPVPKLLGDKVVKSIGELIGAGAAKVDG